MRLHTNTLTSADVYSAVTDLPGVYADVTTHGSRSHDRALEVKLEGTSNRKPNFGTSQTADRFGDGPYAATWDEWGIMFARLYAKDAELVCGPVSHPSYADAEDYHWKTGDRFRTLDIADQHKNHYWRWTEGMPAGERRCKCGATQRWTRKDEVAA